MEVRTQWLADAEGRATTLFIRVDDTNFKCTIEQDILYSETEEEVLIRRALHNLHTLTHELYIKQKGK